MLPADPNVLISVIISTGKHTHDLHFRCKYHLWARRMLGRTLAEKLQCNLHVIKDHYGLAHDCDGTDRS